MFVYRVDEDISLKLPDDCDAHELFSLINDSRDHLTKWLPWVMSTNSIDTIYSFIKGIKEQYVSNLGFKTIILYKGNIAGIIGYHNVNWSRKSASIGYWLGKNYQGNGIMTKSLEVYINYAFNSMNLNKIEIQVAEANIQSRALPEKFKFKIEGILRDAEWLNHKYVNHILYGLLKSEWS